MQNEQVKTFNNGGGVQSTGMLILTALAKRARGGDSRAQDRLHQVTRGMFDLDYILQTLDWPVHLFVNVGDDSESRATLQYVEQYARPYAEENEIEYRVLTHERTLYQELIETERDLIPWAMRMTKSKSGRNGEAIRLSRTCTIDWKIRRVAAEQQRRGAGPASPAITGLGISLDELERMKTKSNIAWQILAYPLIDLRLTRQDCLNVTADEGLPEPPPSRCWFCPVQGISNWRKQRDADGDTFKRAADLERKRNERRVARGAPPIYFARTLQPLEVAVQGEQHDLFDQGCESGFCMT